LHRQHEIEFRVRYPETDPGGYVHHAHYFTYFEMGRTELLRASGRTYRDMEAAGAYVVVVRVECRYHRPAKYDDLLRLRTTILRIRAATIEHEYHLFRGTELLAEARVQLCCVDRDGNPQRWPEWMTIDEAAAITGQSTMS
jgi:acyl-CoA thioester hydrolase